ncbi:MAG: XdhC family protein [Pseudomonadota bacterium]
MAEPITYAEHALDVLQHAVHLQEAGEGCVLITSVDIRGGAARETGSMAVVGADGAMVGYMSNGCVDRDIQLQALDAARSGTRQVLRYGEGASSFDLKLPCGGSLELLLDPTPDPARLRAARDSLLARQSVTIAFDVPERAAPVTFRYTPKTRLVLAGRGAVFRATAYVAHSAGFELVLCSPEDADLDALAALPREATHVLTTPMSAPTFDLDPHCGMLTLFHDHDWEPALLTAALETQASYIGSLGSATTHAARCDSLRAMGVAEEQIARLRGPIGLVPALRQAPAIAISAIAQVVEAFPRAIFPAD